MDDDVRHLPCLYHKQRHSSRREEFRHGCVDFENRGSCGHVDVRADMSPYGDRYLIENCDGRTDNYSLPPHLSPLRSFLTKVKTDLSFNRWLISPFFQQGKVILCWYTTSRIYRVCDIFERRICNVSFPLL